MKVVFLSACSELGGAEQSLLCLLKGLRKLKPAWQIHLISTRTGPLIEAANRAGVETTVTPLPRGLAEMGDAALNGSNTFSSPRIALALNILRSIPALAGYLLRLRSQLKKLQADVLHSNGFKMHFAAGMVKPAKTPLIWHIHDYVSTRPAMKRLLRIMRNTNSGVIANSQSVAADVNRSGITSENVYPIWNAVDLDYFSDAGPKADLDSLAAITAAPDETVRIGLIATYARWKGHEVFLKSLSLLPADLKFRGYVIGGCVYETKGSQFTLQELQALASSLGIADRVAFTGFVSDVPAAMRALDVVVHASTAPEPFGLTIAEAMACARPLIASNAGGAAEIAADVPDVLLHEPGSAQQLAQCIIQTIQRWQRGASVPGLRSYAIHRFSPERFASEISHVYHPAMRTIQECDSSTSTAETSSAA
jgi:glycosyltransferase involved in cell wall biosynthesis